MSSRKTSINYPWTPEKAALWEKDKTINPFTEKPIKEGGETYIRLQESYEKYLLRKQQVQQVLTPKHPLEGVVLSDVEKAIALAASEHPDILGKASILSKGISQYATRKHALRIGKEIREKKYIPLPFVKRLIEHLFDKEQKSLFSDLKKASLTDIHPGVVLLIREEMVSRLQLLRTYTRARSLQTTLKVSETYIPTEETPDSVLKRLDTWCKKYKEIHNGCISIKVDYQLPSTEIPAIEKELARFIYEYYDITQDIARIYTLYILSYLQALLSYVWNVEIEKQKRNYPDRTDFPISFSEDILIVYRDDIDYKMPTLRHVIPYHKLYYYLDPVFDKKTEFIFFKGLIDKNPLNINYRLYNGNGNIKYFIEVLQELESRNPNLVSLLVQLISKKKEFLPPPVQDRLFTSSATGGKRSYTKKRT